ncbi:MAG: insulinase family protein, partial [Burkholderiales bacterium]
MTALPKILFVLMLTCAGLPVASAANAPADDVAVKDLANGLRVIVKPDRRAPVVASMVWYRIGS